MERRSWPWRKKCTDKIPVSPSVRNSQRGLSASQHATSTPQLALPPSVPSSKPEDLTKLNLEQEMTKSSVENARVTEAVLQWQQAEEKVTILTEKLASAMSEIADKNEVAKQHSRVAEEAVLGWEKAKSEALTFKQQLEACRQEKGAAEGRVAHMDEALNECVKQIRQIRDEQEQRIQEAIMKKNREWDRVRTELEAKQTELARQALETGAENSAMSKSLQERARAILEVTEAKARAETQVNVLQVRVESLEKEVSTLKYEIHVLNKELEIRNEEREFSKKSADAAHRQHLDNVRKIAKLESDCQRLRALVRKKLPSPAAVARMKMEFDVLGRESWEGRRRRTPSKGVSMSLDTWQERPQVNANKEVEMLTDRLLAMEEETNLLKEALAKRNNELDAARQMCARTASKLTTVEEQLDHGQAVAKGFSRKLDKIDSMSMKESSLTSKSEDGGPNDDEVSCAESWASALIAELAHFRKDKPVASSRQSLDSCNLDGVDDVFDHDRPPVPSEASTEVNQITNDPQSLLQDINSPRCIASRNPDFHSAYKMCKDVSSKLSIVLENLESLKLISTENEATLSRVQESLISIYEAQDEVSKLDKVLGGIAIFPDDTSIMKLQSESHGNYVNACISSSILEGSHPVGELTLCVNAHAKDIPLSSPGIIPSVSSVMCKIVQLIESLFPVALQHVNLETGVEDNGTKPEEALGPHLEQQMQSLTCMKEKLSQGKLDIMEYLLQLALILSHMSGSDDCELQIARTKLASSNAAEEVEKLVVSNDLKLEVASSLERGEDRQKDTDENQKRNIQEETSCQKLGAYHPSMESVTLIADLQSDLDKLKQDKAAVEGKLGAAEEEIRDLQSKLVDTELLVSALQQQVVSLQGCKEQVERELADAATSQTHLLTQLEDAKVETSQLSEKVTSLMVELEEKQGQYKAQVVKCEDLGQQLKQLIEGSSLQSNELLNSRRSADQDEARSKKEQEVAAAKEKLAECQRTIFVLGKQLNALTTTTSDSLDESLTSSMDSGHLNDNKVVSGISNGEFVAEDSHVDNSRLEMGRRKPYSSVIWTRCDRRLVEHGRPNRAYISDSLEPEIYMASNRGHSQAHYSHFSRRMHPEFIYEGNNRLHSPTPIQEDDDRPMFLYSPPDTALSSPARSPARLVQYNQKKTTSGNAVRMSLAKSMNNVASNSSAKPTKSSGSGSSFSRLFSLNTHHH